MNEKSESWSLPWHALQRRLADNFGANAKIAMTVQSRTPRSHTAPAVAANWLVRARVAAAQGSAAGC